MTANQFQLVKSTRFGPFFATQFFGAFNDNVFKNALIILIAFQATSMTQIDNDVLINVCMGLFILPFFLFSAMAGQLADKFEKSTLIRWIKVAEIVIMLSAAVGFYLNSLWFLLSVLFLLGSQSAFFGPVKYAILPQHLDESELLGGNGLVEMGTFIAILVGTIFGGVFIAIPGYGKLVVSVVIILIAILGWFCSRYIPKAESTGNDIKINLNPITQTWRSIQFARERRTVFLSVLGVSWFWFYGAVMLAQLPNYTKVYLGGGEHVVTFLMVMFSVGVGLGSLLCERMSGHKIEIGLVPFGAFGLSLFIIIIYLLQPEQYHGPELGLTAFLSQWHSVMICANILLLGMFGGFYIVPLYAMIQNRSKPSHRSRIIAANNILNALFMVVAALYAIVLLNIGVSIPMLFCITGIVSACVAIYIFKLVPEFTMRFLVWIMISCLYRIRAENIEKAIPDHGAAVIVCNHLSFIDAVIIAAIVHRPIRFVMDHNIFKVPVFNFIFKTARAIPIASAKEDPELKEQAFKDIAEALEAGDLVGIFPEGAITRDGQIQTFRPGIEQIIKTTPVPVIPLAIRNLYGSFFSRKYGKAMMCLPRKLFAKIGLVAGEPVAPEKVTAAHLQQIVSDLRGDAM